MTLPSLTACILTYNSESGIRETLESVLPYVDQLVVVDSGSTDQTVPIVRSFGVQVTPFEWADDFSIARNVAIEKATGDWILFLDSDETFHWTHPDLSLKEFLAVNDSFTGVYALPCRNIEQATGEMQTWSHAERLFPRGRYTYQGAIHEALQGSGKVIRVLPDCFLEHVGYSADRIEAKSQRNLKLLQQELAQDKDNGRLHRYLANEFFNAGQYRDSIRHCQRALALLPKHETYTRAQTYFYWMTSWLLLGETDRSMHIAKRAMEEIPSYTDPYALAFEVASRQKEWQTARDMFARWNELKSEQRLLPQHLTSLNHPLEGRSDQMGLTVALLGLDHDNDLAEVKRQLDAIPLHKQVVIVGESFSEEMRKAAAGYRYELHEVATNRSILERQLTAMRAAREEWVLFLEGRERVADAGDLAELVVSSAEAAYAAEVRYQTDRLRVSVVEWRLLKKGTDLSRFRPLDAAAPRLVLHQEFLQVEVPARAPATSRMSVADGAQASLPAAEKRMRDAWQAFSLQEYEKALSILADIQHHRHAPFFMILAGINLGRTHEALQLLQNVINDEEEDTASHEYAYLYARLMTAIDDPEVKQEAIELLIDAFSSADGAQGVFLDLAPEDHLLAAGDLYGQLGRWEQAKDRYADAVASSGYENERAAYRYADALRQLTEAESRQSDLPRLLMADLPSQDPKAKRLLYLLYRYLGFDEWAILFYPFHESSRYERPRGEVSVILPVYNQSDYLRASIKSVLRQSHTRFELIIVDDGSTEDISSVVEEFWYDRRIVFHRLERNQGLPAALNAGLALATGTFLTWHSADNLMGERMLERLVSALMADESKAAAYADYIQIDHEGLLIEKIRNRPYEMNGLANPGPALVWRATAGRRAGGFDTSMFGIEDRDFVFRLRTKGPFVHVPEPLYSYRIHKESLSAEIDDQERFGGWDALHGRLKRKWFYWHFI